MSGHGATTAKQARVGVAVPAAGSGRRMGGVRKPFLELAGEPVLVHALRPFLADERVVSISVALGGEDAANPPDWLTELDPRVVVVAGGASRGESVALALAAIEDGVTIIAVHDAARPLVTTHVVSACIDLAAAGISAVAGYPAVDTMKTVDADGHIVSTPERANLWHAQTPQVFPAELLLRAYEGGSLDATDDATLVEQAGGVVRMIDGGPFNMKVTRPTDFVVAEAILRARNGR